MAHPEPERIVEKTGIMPDYANEWFIYCRSKIKKYSTKKAYENLKSKNVHIKKYEEKYSIDEYEGLVTEKNRKQIKFLDRIVDELNSMLKNHSKFNSKRFDTLTNRALVLIYGESEKEHEKVRIRDETGIRSYEE